MRSAESCGPLSTSPLTLPARFYTDAKLFRREMDAFFFESWFYAGREDDIPNRGDYVLREVAGESLILLRRDDGEVSAFFNVCRHRGTQLCTAREGRLSGKIVCPYHGWSYSFDGRLIGAPHMDAQQFRRDDFSLHALHADVWAGNMFLNAQPSRQPLTDYLGDLPQKFAPWRMQDLRCVKRISYSLRANWKLIIANYNECLHCPLLHPALNRLTDYLGSDNESPHPNYLGVPWVFVAEPRP